MSGISEKQDAVVREFMALGDGFWKYSYLIELAGTLPRMDESKKTGENLVRGCQSSVWLDVRISGGLFFFEADSDSLIIRGVLRLLQDIMCSEPVSDVAGAEIDFLQRAGLMETFALDRQKGIGFIVKTLQEKARRAISEQPGGAGPA